jgi:CRISPR/Cas system-associated exonuclease Cas4 (RecB family)
MQYIEIPLEVEPENPFISELEKDLKAEKAMQYLENMQTQPQNAEKTALHMHKLKENYFVFEKEKVLLMETHNVDRWELSPLEYRAEFMEIHVDNLENLQGRVVQLWESRRNVSFMDFKQKKDVDEKIKQTEQEIKRAREFFRNRFNIDPAQASAELKRLQEAIRIKRDDLHAKQVLVQAIRKKQDAVELEYHTQKLLNEIHPEHQQITRQVEKMNTPPESTHEKRLHEQISHRLNTLAEENFQKVIENLPPYQAHILTTIREQAKKRERLIEKERDRSIDRSR